MREVLIARITPLVEAFAGELADLLVADVERRVEQLRDSFAVALSSFAGEIAGDQDVRDGGLTLPRMAVPEPAVVAEQGSTSPRSAGRKPNSCRNCGAVGFTAATCGKTHNVSTSPAPDAPTASTPTSGRSASAPATSPLISAPPPPNRSAAIAAANERREAARRERGERAASFVRRGDGPTRGAPGSVELDDVAEEPRVASLPEVLSSFEL